MKAGKTGILSDLRMLKHYSKPRHPESPARVKAILKMLAEKQLLTHHRVHYLPQYDRMASDDDIRMVYPQKYVDYLRKLWPQDETRISISLSDSYCNQDTEIAARISAGGVLQGIDRIMNGEWNNGFCVVRPPGHHSGEKGKINGFCVLNNVALGARYLELKHDLSRIAILDYDVHQGDGTHHIFNQNSNILFISVHRYDRGSYYPGGAGGDFPNCGVGEAQGTKLNIPLNIVGKKRKRYDFQAPGDNEYVYLYNRIIHPILQQFDPQFILVSSGFDASRKDYLGGFTVTPNGYFYMTRRLQQFKRPVLCVLEGGYHLGSTAQAATAVVRGLLEQEELPQPVKGVTYENIHFKCHLQQEYHEDLDEVIEHHSKYWKSLASEKNVEYTKIIKQNTEKIFGVFHEESSSSSSEQVDEEESSKQESETQAEAQKSFQKPLQFYNREQSAENNPKIFKNFSYTNKRVLKLINEQQAKFYDCKFPEKRFAPRCFGKQGNYLILQNILCKQKGATIVEVKLSRQSKNPHLSEEQLIKEAKKESQSTSEKLAFRVSGLTTPQHKQNGLLIDDQGTAKKILKKVIDAKSKTVYAVFLTKLAEQLRTANRLYFGTSILFIKGKEDNLIYWVNFNYWYPHDSYDIGTAEGLQNLVKWVKELE